MSGWKIVLTFLAMGVVVGLSVLIFAARAEAQVCSGMPSQWPDTNVCVTGENESLQANRAGDGSKLATTDGTGTAGVCVEWDANGNLVDAASADACGAGGGGGGIPHQVNGVAFDGTTLDFTDSFTVKFDNSVTNKLGARFGIDTIAELQACLAQTTNSRYCKVSGTIDVGVEVELAPAQPASGEAADIVIDATGAAFFSTTTSAHTGPARVYFNCGGLPTGTRCRWDGGIIAGSENASGETAMAVFAPGTSNQLSNRMEVYGISITRGLAEAGDRAWIDVSNPQTSGAQGTIVVSGSTFRSRADVITVSVSQSALSDFSFVGNTVESWGSLGGAANGRGDITESLCINDLATGTRGVSGDAGGGNVNLSDSQFSNCGGFSYGHRSLVGTPITLNNIGRLDVVSSHTVSSFSGDETQITVSPSPGWDATTRGEHEGRTIQFTSFTAGCPNISANNGRSMLIASNTADTITLARKVPNCALEAGLNFDINDADPVFFVPAGVGNFSFLLDIVTQTWTALNPNPRATNGPMYEMRGTDHAGRIEHIDWHGEWGINSSAVVAYQPGSPPIRPIETVNWVYRTSFGTSPELDQSLAQLEPLGASMRGGAAIFYNDHRSRFVYDEWVAEYIGNQLANFGTLIEVRRVGFQGNQGAELTQRAAGACPTLTIPAIDTFVTVDGFTLSGDSIGYKIDGTSGAEFMGNRLDNGGAGENYTASLSYAMSGEGNGSATYEACVHNNGVLLPECCQSSESWAAGGRGSLSSTCGARVTAGDVLTLQVQNLKDASDINVCSATLKVD